MEQGEVKNYNKTDKIERIRRPNAQRHVPQTASSLQNSTSKKFGSKVTKSMPCQFFNQGSCSHQKSHETRDTLYKHICTSCFAATGRTFPHSEFECHNKNKKTRKKRVTLGVGHCTNTRGFSTRVLYGTNVGFPTCRQEIEADKALALQWFHVQRMFQQTSNKLSYAEALRKPPPTNSPNTNTVNRTVGTTPSLCPKQKNYQKAQADTRPNITCKNVLNKKINKTNRAHAVQHETLALCNRIEPLQEPDNVHISTKDSDMSESNLELENNTQALNDNISE